MKEKLDWMTLSQVAELLGVHPSTVRLWSDKGQIPVQRTQGNHRRYLRTEVELWAKTARQTENLEPANVIQHALSNMRFRITENNLEAESWYHKLNDDARMQYRMSGRILVQGLSNFLASQGQDAMSEAHAIGYEYASRGRTCNLDSIDAVRAFLFFRNALLQSIIDVYREAHIPSGTAWSGMLNKVHTFTDNILISLLETYQSFENKTI
jgi:excisionase family DNA binding protein